MQLDQSLTKVCSVDYLDRRIPLLILHTNACQECYDVTATICLLAQVFELNKRDKGVRCYKYIQGSENSSDTNCLTKNQLSDEFSTILKLQDISITADS